MSRGFPHCTLKFADNTKIAPTPSSQKEQPVPVLLINPYLRSLRLLITLKITLPCPPETDEVNQHEDKEHQKCLRKEVFR